MVGRYVVTKHNTILITTAAAAARGSKSILESSVAWFEGPAQHTRRQEPTLIAK